MMPPYAREICLAGRGAACCRYLGAGPNGLVCLKLDPGLRPYLDQRVALGTINARGDNCSGASPEVLNAE